MTEHAAATAPQSATALLVQHVLHRGPSRWDLINLVVALALAKACGIW